MMKLTTGITTILSLVGTTIAQERAHVIVMKDFSSFELGDGVEFNVTYDVHNVGDASATEVKISDQFPDSTFEIVKGSLEKTIDEIGAGESVKHIVTLKPLVGGGIINIPPADVEYTWNEKDQDTDEDESMTVNTKSSAIGSVQILTADEYAARNSQHVTEWSVFSSFSGLAILFPFFLWRSKSSKFHSSGRVKLG
jgi:uncharacterized repeat protein (TIGR01451 family)